MGKLNYPYIKNDILESKVSYSYSVYGGAKFLKAWEDSRNQYVLAGVDPWDSQEIFILSKEIDEDKTETRIMLNQWISDGRDNSFDFANLNLLLKRFEVVKRIYGQYDVKLRPLDKKDFDHRALYLKFAYVLAMAYKATQKLQYLNSLLKIIDISCSIYYLFNSEEKKVLSSLIYGERIFVENLKLRLRDDTI